MNTVEKTACDSIGGATHAAYVDAGSMAPITGPVAVANLQWYALQARFRFERKTASHLDRLGVETLLPMAKEVHRWSDRRKIIESPLFPGYVFARLDLDTPARLQALQAPGVFDFVKFGGSVPPIPEKQIADVRTLLSQDVMCTVYPFLTVGQRVRIRGGCLEGLEGILVARNGNKTLVISIEPVQRSIAVTIGDYTVEPIR